MTNRGLAPRTGTIVLALGVLLFGCESPSKQFVGVGDIVAVDDPAHVTIRHDAIVGLTDAATTQFEVDTAALREVTVGQRVRFELTKRERTIVSKISPLAEGNPGMHDHTPHHGGVVAMVGMIHLEARAERDGRVLLYLTDRF